MNIVVNNRNLARPPNKYMYEKGRFNKNAYLPETDSCKIGTGNEVLSAKRISL